MATSNANVAHQWAAQSRDSATGSHFYFEGRTIYSYGPHFPIATFTDGQDQDGRTIVLFTVQDYSNTTARHKSLVWRALYGLDHVRVIQVWDASDFRPTHESNARDIAARYAETMAKASRARKYADQYLASAQRLAEDCVAYCYAFGLELPAMAEADIEQAREAAKRNAAREREQARARKEAKRLDFERDAALWRAGAPVSMWEYDDFPTLLRVRGDTIETSRGAQVPASVAPGLWAAVQRARDGETRWRYRYLIGMKIGDFTLREVRKDGSLVIGCHTIEYAELALMAFSLGYTNEVLVQSMAERMQGVA